MFELLMTFCLAGEPCTTETLAIFPSEEAGKTLCDIASPAIESAIRAKASADAVITFSCPEVAMPRVPQYRPSIRRDDRVSMVRADDTSPLGAAIEALDRIAK